MRKTTKLLAAAGLLVALDIVFARFLSFYTWDYAVRVGPQFLAHAMAGWLLGPVWALGTAVAGDILGMLINSAGLSFLPGYTLSAAMSGLLYGLLLHRRPVRNPDVRRPAARGLLRAALAVGTVTLVVSLGMGSLWSLLYFGKGWWGVFLLALPWRALLWPVYTALLYAAQQGLDRAGVRERLQGGPPS